MAFESVPEVSSSSALTAAIFFAGLSFEGFSFSFLELLHYTAKWPTFLQSLHFFPLAGQCFLQFEPRTCSVLQLGQSLMLCLIALTDGESTVVDDFAYSLA